MLAASYVSGLITGIVFPYANYEIHNSEFVYFLLCYFQTKELGMTFHNYMKLPYETSNMQELLCSMSYAPMTLQVNSI